eukprot:275631_1
MGRNKIPSDGVLETMGYRELQTLAKTHGISGKQAGVVIMSDLREERDKKAGGQTKSTPKPKKSKATPTPSKGTTTKRRGPVKSKLSHESQTPQQVTRSTRKSEIKVKEEEPQQYCCCTGSSLLWIVVALFASVLLMRGGGCANLKEALQAISEKLLSNIALIFGHHI